MALSNSPYFVLESSDPDMMLFYSLLNVSLRDRWFAGQKFSKPPEVPVKVRIIEDNEDGKLLAYHNPVCLMSNALADVVSKAGVDNIDFYDAVIVDATGKVRQQGYKVFNLIGKIRAADLQKTEFMTNNESRLVDASIEKLALDEKKARGALMFRLAEAVGTVVVHASVARAIDAANFEGVELQEIDDLIVP
jgi:hypothetical protein